MWSWSRDRIEAGADAVTAIAEALRWISALDEPPSELWGHSYVLGCVQSLLNASVLAWNLRLTTEERGETLIEVVRALKADPLYVSGNIANLCRIEDQEFWRGAEEPFRSYCVLRGNLKSEQLARREVQHALKWAEANPGNELFLFPWPRPAEGNQRAAGLMMWEYLGAASYRLGYRQPQPNTFPFG